MEYANQAERSHTTLVEAFRNMPMDEEELLENGNSNLEVCAVCKFHITFKGKKLFLGSFLSKRLELVEDI